MRTLWTTVKKELASYFYSPVAYVVAVLFYLFRGAEVQSVTAVIAAAIMLWMISRVAMTKATPRARINA